ncbi:MAG: DUF2256 domain-containing protein [Rubricoccaceae bacterium]
MASAGPRYRKPHLPEKTCPVCRRPFAWRKKWARDWERVVYCSERCRRQGHTRGERPEHGLRA